MISDNFDDIVCLHKNNGLKEGLQTFTSDCMLMCGNLVSSVSYGKKKATTHNRSGNAQEKSSSVWCHLFCFSVSSSLWTSLVRLSAWFFSSSSVPLQASHCLSFSSSSSFMVSSSRTCSSSIVHVVFRVSRFYSDKKLSFY